MLLVSVYLIFFISFDCCLLFLFLCFSFAVCRIHPLSLPFALSSCLGCISPLIGLPLLRSNPLRSVSYGCLLFVSYFCAFKVCFLCFLLVRRCPFTLLATFFVSVLFLLLSAVPAFLRTYSRFDLVRFRLSCDHGWVRSGLANNVR